ncbi:hypothetical protein GCM10010272_62700 [Streptomyces lateritius]|nr:hypothetical protein GCM10010272_62700 [Streptomyces lateritius]
MSPVRGHGHQRVPATVHSADAGLRATSGRQRQWSAQCLKDFTARPRSAGLPPPGPAPLVTCDGCDRAIRTHDPDTRCVDCRTATEGAAA